MTMFTTSSATLTAMLVVAPKNDIRTQLNGVYFERVNNRLFVVATDGDRMLIQETVSEGDDFAFIMPRADAEYLAKLKAPKLYVEQSADGSWQSRGKLIVPIDGRYPDWRRVVPEKTSGEAGNYDFAYLGDIAKIGKALGVRWPVLHQNGPEGAAKFTFDESTYGLIMPVRV